MSVISTLHLQMCHVVSECSLILYIIMSIVSLVSMHQSSLQFVWSTWLILLHDIFEFLNCCFNIGVCDLIVSNKASRSLCHRADLDNRHILSKLSSFFFSDLMGTIILYMCCLEIAAKVFIYQECLYFHDQLSLRKYESYSNLSISYRNLYCNLTVAKRSQNSLEVICLLLMYIMRILVWRFS
jgi:hypothetical protein